MGIVLMCANSFSMFPKLSLSANDKSFINQFSPDMQSAINDVIEIRTAFILQKSYFALIGDKTSLGEANLLEANNAFEKIKNELNLRENKLKELLQNQVKVSEEGYYNYIFGRMKNFVNRLLGYQNTEIEQYISLKTVEELQQFIKQLEEQRNVLLFNREQNKTLELDNRIRQLDIVIKAINDEVYKLQPISGRIISRIKNTFWRS